MAQITPAEKNQLQIKKDISDNVISNLERLKSEGLTLPPNYSATNALKSAWFKIMETVNIDKKPALEVCTQQSVINALMDMVIQGLSPAKTQCYFVVYGNKLQMTRSYFGTQAAIKRLKEVDDIWANVIYKDDVFVFENKFGRDKLVKHESKLENRDKEIIGAYAIVKLTNGEEIMTLMTKKEIESAWSQSKTNQSVHKKFPQEMAKRTVINRAAKAFVNTSDDSDILIEAINNTTANEYEQSESIESNIEAIDAEINTKANSLEFEESEADAKAIEYNDLTGEVAEEPTTTSNQWDI